MNHGPIIVLTIAERNRFADWLQQDIETNKLLLEQLSKLGSDGESVAKRMKIETTCEMIVYKKLRDIQEETITVKNEYDKET